jgi:hypothetical protein
LTNRILLSSAIAREAVVHPIAGETAVATEVTEKQRQAVEALEGARREGKTLRAYAQSHGLAIQDLYNALAALRRKGLLATPARSARGKFVAVRIEPGATQVSAAGRNSVLCRIVHPRGYLIECTQWPPPSWLESLTTSSTDAAT